MCKAIVYFKDLHTEETTFNNEYEITVYMSINPDICTIKYVVEQEEL